MSDRDTTNRPIARLSAARSSATGLILHACVALFTILLGLPTLVLPLHPDQATFAVIGRVIAEGGVPFVDAWDQKPPALYLIYALAVRLPVEIMTGIRLFDLAWTALTAAMVFALGRRWWSIGAGLTAAAIYALVWSTDLPWWQSGQPDSLVVLPLLTGLLLFDAARSNVAKLILAGMVLGFASQLRFNIFLFIPVLPFVAVGGLPARAGTANRLHRLMWVVVGFTLTQVTFALYLASGSALGEYAAALRSAAEYTRRGGPWNPEEGPTVPAYLNALRTAFWNWASFRALVALPALAAGCYGAVIAREPHIRRLVLLSVLAYAGISLQAKFFWYHYGYIMPLMALIGGWGWDRFLAVLRERRSTPTVAAVTGLMVFGLALITPQVWDSGIASWQGLERSLRSGELRETYRETFFGYSGARAVAEHVLSRTMPDDTIYVWGFDPLIYLLAERSSASRFVYALPLMSAWTPAQWQEGFIVELEQHRPAYIVVERGQAGNWIVGHTIDIADYVNHFPAFRQLLDERYVYEGDVAGAIIYRRR